MSTFVIAEAGSCHDGVFEKAIDLINVARDSGANACKFQYWSSALRLAERRRAEKYFPIYDRYQIPASWLPRLAGACQARGLEFMCTAYLPEDIAVVAPHVQRFKIASFEANDDAFVQAHIPYRKRIIISTGMNAVPLQGPLIDRLHCVSAYPTPVYEANLAAIRLEGYGDAYQGFSDHTTCIYAGAFAVCAGASIVEVHIKLETTDPKNPDAPTALCPVQFDHYVQMIRLAEQMLGTGEKRMMPCEAPMVQYRVTV